MMTREKPNVEKIAWSGRLRAVRSSNLGDILLTTLTNYTAEFFSASISLQDSSRPDTTDIYPQITQIYAG